MILNADLQCQICHSMSFEGDEYAIVHTHDKDYTACILCAVAAERVGWSLTI